MPNSVDIANGVATYFKDGTSDAGKGDSETAAAHKAVNDDLSGSICPDCHAQVKGSLVGAFGAPASDANAGEMTPEEASKAQIAAVGQPSNNPLEKLRHPNGI